LSSLKNRCGDIEICAINSVHAVGQGEGSRFAQKKKLKLMYLPWRPWLIPEGALELV
jgi:hypothetical protein